jgi:hypothetical protein
MEIAHVTTVALGEAAKAGRHVVKVIPMDLDRTRKPEVAIGTLELGRTGARGWFLVMKSWGQRGRAHWAGFGQVRGQCTAVVVGNTKCCEVWLDRLPRQEQAFAQVVVLLVCAHSLVCATPASSNAAP